MQEHFNYFTCLLYKVNGGVATTPSPLVDFEDLPYPRGRPYTLVFASK